MPPGQILVNQSKVSHRQRLHYDISRIYCKCQNLLKGRFSFLAQGKAKHTSGCISQRLYSDKPVFRRSILQLLVYIKKKPHCFFRSCLQHEDASVVKEYLRSQIGICLLYTFKQIQCFLRFTNVGSQINPHQLYPGPFLV